MNTPLDNLITVIFVILIVAGVVYSILRPEDRDGAWYHWWIQ